MAFVGEEITNPRTGQRMGFRTLTRELLEIESWNPPHCPAESDHVHPNQESGARVLSGALRFWVAGRPCDVRPGESILIPVGVAHRFANPFDEPAHWLGFFRPALNIAAFFEAYFELARAGNLDERGMPSLWQLAVMLPVFEREIRPTGPPWPLLKAATTVLAPVARRRGYRAVPCAIEPRGA